MPSWYTQQRGPQRVCEPTGVMNTRALLVSAILWAGCTSAAPAPQEEPRAEKVEENSETAINSYEFEDIPWGTPVERAKLMLSAKGYRLKRETSPQEGKTKVSFGTVRMAGRIWNHAVEIQMYYSPRQGVVRIEAEFALDESAPDTFEHLRRTLCDKHSINRVAPSLRGDQSCGVTEVGGRFDWPWANDDSRVSLERRDAATGSKVVVSYVNLVRSTRAADELRIFPPLTL